MRIGFTPFTAAAAMVTVLAAAGCSNRELLSRTEGRATDAYAAGDFEAAFVDYSTVLDKRPHSALANYNSGRTLLRLGRPAEAVENFAIAAELERGSTKYRAAYAEAMFQAGYTEELRAELARIAEELNTADAHMLAGSYASRLGFPDEARRSFTNAAALGPEAGVRAHLALAELYRDLGDDEQALWQLRRALALDPDNTRVRDIVREMGEIPGPSFLAGEDPAG